MQFHLSDDTIFALSTPEGLGALSVIRMTGKDTLKIVSHIFRKKGGMNWNSIKFPSVHYGDIVEGDLVIDEVLLTIFKGPNSFTGEDTAEISCHGSSYIRFKIMELLLSSGARQAREGEFTKRAFMNGKMDLSRAEAVADLIHAESESAHRVALHQLRGGFANELSVLRDKLIGFASLIELELDFSEEDVEFANRTDLKKHVSEIQTLVKDLRDSFKKGNAIKNGIPVAIVGAPNSGKSTLLNALLNEEKAIVSSVAGTTRDVIEDTLNIKGVMFRVIDTAGIRENPDNEIEQIGIERTFEKIKSAQIVLYVCDAGNSNQAGDDLALEIKNAALMQKNFPDAAVLIIANKMDLRNLPISNNTQIPLISISAKKKEGLDILKEKMWELSGVSGFQGQTVVSNIRHYQALNKASAALDKVMNGLDSGISGDFVAMDIRQALFHLGEISGEVSTEDLLGSIFSRFCIGK